MGHQKAHRVGVPPDIAQHPAPDLHKTIVALAVSLGPHHDVVTKWAADPSSFLSADSNSSSQHWWADQVGKARRARLETMGTARDQVRLRGLTAQEGPIATAWLSLTPNRCANTSLCDQDFRSLCR